MGDRRLLAAALALYALLAHAGHAQRMESPYVQEQEITIVAEELSYEQKTNSIIARGNVVITRGETELQADEVRFNRATNEADAQGNVRLTNSEGTVVADTVHMNLDEETGSLKDAEIRSLRSRYSLGGARVEKGLGQTYHIENGQFTTCHCAKGAPSWSISGRELDVTLEGYGTLAGGTFKVLDVPILYIPRAIFPVQQERQSGLLDPRFGFSNTRGFQTFLPVYWAINKSQDATVALDFETSARAGLVGEYRYTLSRETRGFLDGSYFNESFRGGTPVKPFETTIPENRWSVTAEHDQPLLGTSRLYGDLFLVSDDLFLREINTYAFEHSQDVAIRTLPFTQSHLAAVQLWDRVALKGEGTYYQDLTGFQSPTLQRAPEVDLWGQTLLGQHVLGQLTATAVDFQRARGVDGARLDIEPAAVLPLPLGRFAFGSVRAALRETAYHLTEDRLADTAQTLPQNQSRELFQLGAEMGASLSRIYPVTSFGLEKLKHTIEPTVEYLYTPAVSQANLPLFDGVDRINQRNLLTYGVVSRFIGKFSGSPSSAGDETSSEAAHAQIRELGRFSLTQSVDISRKINPLQPDRAADHFSDIDFDGRLNPSRTLSVRFHTNYDAGNTNLSAAHVGLFIEDPRGAPSITEAPRLDTRTSAGISYRFLTQNLLQELDDNIVLRLTDSVGLLYSSRYDVVANRFLDNFFGLRLISTCDCWAFDFGVTDRTNPQELAVQAQVTLVGLGSSKPPARVAAAP
ncbi:MAG: LPS-assembly protein LptD [Candidatus Binatia bacterium]